MAVARAFLMFWAMVLSHAPAWPAEPGPGVELPGKPQSGAPVMVDGRSLFRVAGVAAYPAERRASEIAARIVALAQDDAFKADSITVRTEGNRSELQGAGKPILYVLEADARLAGVEPDILAFAVRERVVDAINEYRVERTPAYLTRYLSFALVATALMVLILWGLRRGLIRLGRIAHNRFLEKVRTGRHSDSLEAVHPEHMTAVVVQGAAVLVWWTSALALIYLYLGHVLSRFPWTRQSANWLLDLVIEPLQGMGRAVLNFVPNLAFLVILFVLVRYFLRLAQLFFVAAERGSVHLGGFERDWAMPTYRLIRFAVVAFAVVIAFPYLPGSSSEAFKGVSVFIGVLFSIGSSSIISNTLAGYSLLYRRAFRVGDRVKIGAHVGDVVEVRQQVTLLRTPKNEDVLIPNSTILGSEVINYSVQARESRLLLHTSVTIGYDTPWRQVEALLLDAARRTAGLSLEPPPFVLERSLGDFHVDYELNVCCDDAVAMPRLYAALHRNILDTFNEHGVQIMSPHFETQPDKAVVVPKDRWFAPPAERDRGEAAG